MKALEILKYFEGCKLEAYPDPATGGEPWTIGWGSTRDRNGNPIKPGMKITQKEADALLERDFDACVLELCEDKRIRALPDDVVGAMACLCYNIGVNAFKRSKCYKAVLDKDLEQVCRQWDWYKANGKFMKGLARRRIKELDLLLSAWK
jgi:lysozyme